MHDGRTRRFAVTILLAVGLLVLATSCGGDPWSGAWTAPIGQNPPPALTISKDGDGWKVVDGDGRVFTAVEQDGKLVLTTGAREVLVREGDKLRLKEPDGTSILLTRAQ